MSGLFSKPSIPTPAAPVAPPTIDQAAAANDYADRLRRRQGAASTVLVPPSLGSIGVGSNLIAPMTPAKALLGA